MKTSIITCVLAFLCIITGCSKKTEEKTTSFAIYTEFARGYNKPLKDSLNRRVFNDTTAQMGKDISLGDSGVITINPGTYRLTGFSLVTMQTNLPVPYQGYNYPGYCIIYKLQDEQSKNILNDALGLGNIVSSNNFTPSTFDILYTFKEKTQICVGHQSGAHFVAPIYLTLYETDSGETSNYHAFARIAIEKMD